MKEVISIMEYSREGASKFFTSWGEWAGVFPKGTEEINDSVNAIKTNIKELKKVEEEYAAAAKKEASARSSSLEKSAAIEKKIADELEAANVANITDKGTLRSLLEDELATLLELERIDSKDAKVTE